MLSKRRSQNNKICVLRINNKVLDIDGVIITDQNAARECWFKTVDEGLSLLNKEEIYATFWIDDNDPIKEDKQKGIKCAEVLVPDRVHSDYIFGAYVANSVAFDNLCNLSNINGIIKSELFF
jgi:Pyruvate/2-oxoacid:ferredoxin oxidoreductase gamma subunit